MKLSEMVKPISYIKAHASEVIRQVAEKREPVIITLNGEAKAVIQDIKEYEKNQESLAMLKVLALGRKSLEEGRVKAARKAFKDLRSRIEAAGRDEL